MTGTAAEDKSVKYLDARNLFQYYIYPTMYGIILVVGLAGNGALLTTFARHKDVRTAPNIMIFNLAVADVINLLVNTPLYYIFKYYSNKINPGSGICKVFCVFRFVNQAVMYMSVVALSAQRYFGIVSALKTKQGCCRLSARTSAAIFIFSVWFVALIIGLPPNLLYEFREGECFPKVRKETLLQVMDILYCVFCSVLPPTLVAIFNILTARLLKRSACDMPGVLRNNAQKIARYRSARVVTALTITFAICYIPRNVWFFLASYYHFSSQETLFICVDEITNYLLFSNSVQNPIALYFASDVFKKLFNKYLFWCCSKNESTLISNNSRTTSSSNV